MLGNIPIQATTYYLPYLKPIGNDGKWDRRILEFMHSQVVFKMALVRVADNVSDIENTKRAHVPCSITVGVMTLNTVLVAEKLAERTDDINVHIKLPDTYDFYEDDSKTTNRDVDLYKESSLPLDEFKEIIAKRNEAKKEKEYLDDFDMNCAIDYVIEDSDAECYKRSDHRDSYELDIDIDDFEPLDTSSLISTSVKFSLVPFMPIKLSKDITKFPCKIYEVLDPLHLFIEPIIDKYNDEYNAMENKLKKFSHKLVDECDMTETRVCLARYTADKCYYRAIIKDRTSKSQVRVRYVDYLNEEIVERKYVRECPDEFLTKPLKHLVVKLHGIKAAKRVRDTDIINRLKELIGRDVLAVVVKNDTIPSVHLYNSLENSNVLVYQPLINTHFLTKLKD